MCLIVFAYNVHPRYRLLLAGNRDEVYTRASAPIGYWPDHPHVLGGRDLELMGTWLGITRSGRLAAVTNYREGPAPQKKPSSRGHLVSNYLLDDIGPLPYLERIVLQAEAYAGFNLLTGDAHSLYYFSNRHPQIQRVPPGIHGLSNHLLDTPWPKVRRAVDGIKAIIEKKTEILIEDVLELLTDQSEVSDQDLPASGVDLQWERMLAPVFIASPTYGTRCSSVLLIDTDRTVTLFERTWQPGRKKPVAAGDKCYQFVLNR